MKYDLYALLNVAHDASQESIAAACAERLDAATEHGTEVALRHAREVLCNPVTRAAYDTKLRQQVASLGHSRVVPEKATGAGSNSKLLGLVVVGLVMLVLWWVSARKPAPVLPAVQPANPVARRLVGQHANALAPDRAECSVGVWAKGC